MLDESDNHDVEDLLRRLTDIDSITLELQDDKTSYGMLGFCLMILSNDMVLSVAGFLWMQISWKTKTLKWLY